MQKRNKDLIAKIIENVKATTKLRHQPNELVFTEAFLKEHGAIVKKLQELSGLSSEQIIA